MGLRQRGYWIRQAGAVRRQSIAAFAHAVSIGMSGDRAERERAMDDLELYKTAKASRDERSKATWSLMSLFGGGKGV